MKVVSFNVNSVRLRLHQIEAVIAQHDPDVIALQETKVQDHEFPLDSINALGYDVVFHGQKTHYGVATMTRLPYASVMKGFPDDSEEAQRRIIAIDVKTRQGAKVTVINGYFPQGESRRHAVKFPAKEKFYADTLSLLKTHCDVKEPVLVTGDFNVAPLDQDIGIAAENAKRWLRDGKAAFLPEEREWLAALADWGLVDTFRQQHPDVTDRFSWFDYRSRGFDREPKRGLRIDHLYASRPLAEKLIDSGINYEIRGMEKPSDHCPVWSEFSI